MKRFTAIDLFCGAGGLSVGLKKAGFRVLAGVELDECAVETYQMNHRNHVIYQDDIRNIDPERMLSDLKIKPGELDLLAGCPPCQGFSAHRTRNKTPSVQDARNDLVYEFMRFVDVLNPKALMMENVPGLAADSRMDDIKRMLSDWGYVLDENSVCIKDAADYGVPQRRRRMILQASRYGLVKQPRQSRKKKTVFDAIGSLSRPGRTGDILHDMLVKRTDQVNKMIKLVPKNGGSRTDLPKKHWLPCHLRYPGGYRDVYGRMSWNQVAPTITGGCHNPSKGRFLHPTQNRAITLREAALLQSFPPKYKFSMSKGRDSVALMIGNALPPTFVQRHASAIRKHLEVFENG